MDPLRLTKLSDVTASRVSKLCPFRTVHSARFPGPSLSLLQRQDIPNTCSPWYSSGYVADVPVSSQVSAGCQCRWCASNCWWRCACRDVVAITTHGLVCHSPGLHSLLHPARTRSDLRWCHCLDILRCTTCITLSSIAPICSKCSSYQNRSTTQQPDPRTLPHHPTTPSNRVVNLSLPEFNWDKTASGSATSTPRVSRVWISST